MIHGRHKGVSLNFQTKIPTEVLISERREYELAEEGFIGLTMRKGSDNAAFFSANSVQKAKFFGISKEGSMPAADIGLLYAPVCRRPEGVSHACASTQ